MCVMNNSREVRLNAARDVLKRAGQAGARIVETMPSQGGFRQRDAQILIDAGEAEWVEYGTIARLKQPDSTNSPSASARS